MRPIRFLHAADLHLDSPFRGHVEHAGEFGPSIREATFATFARIVDTAIAEKVDFVLLAGDLYDAKDRSLRAQLKLRDGLAKLDAAHIRSFVVHGNHDPIPGRASQVKLPPLAHVFDSRIETIEVKREWETVATVTGVSYARADVADNLARQFPDPAKDAPFAIALLHANLGGDTGHANYAPCSREDLAAKSYRYWALGHVHEQAVHRLRPDVIAAYPGNPQGRSVRETGPRGCLLVDVAESGNVATKSVILDEVRWHRPRVSIEGCATIDALEERIGDEVRATMNDGHAHEPAGHVLRVELAGRGPLHATLSRPADLDELAKALRRRWISQSSPRRFVLIEGLVDATGRATDRAALREEQTLLGDALRLSDELKSHDAPDRAKLREALEPLWKRTRGAVAAPTDEDLDRLLERAAEMAIDLLDEDVA